MKFGKWEITRRKDMYHDATYAGRDAQGHFVYVSNWVRDLFGGGDMSKVSYNLTEAGQKSLALRYCPPLAMVADRCARMMQNGVLYVTDDENNERKEYADIVKVLKTPSPLTTWRALIYAIEQTLLVYGYCPLYVARATEHAPIIGLQVIEPKHFHQESTGRMIGVTAVGDMITRTYIEYGGMQIDLQPYEYTVITSHRVMVTSVGEHIRYSSQTDSLSQAVNNYMSAMIARGNLIINGGPKGIVYSNDTGDVGNQALTPSEKEEINKSFKSRFGLVNKMYQIMVTTKRVGYIPLGSNTDQLKLHEETDACRNAICNVLGVQPDLFSQGATFDNKESAKRATYQDVIIPDALMICEALSRLFSQGKDVKIALDFTDVPCLQVNKKTWRSR